MYAESAICDLHGRAHTATRISCRDSSLEYVVGVAQAVSATRVRLMKGGLMRGGLTSIRPSIRRFIPGGRDHAFAYRATLANDSGRAAAAVE